MIIYADKESEKVIEIILQKIPEADFDIKLPEATSCIHDTIRAAIRGSQTYLVECYDERGSVTVKEFNNYGEFFYEILNFVISCISIAYERSERLYRDKSTDFRRLYFNKEIELFKRFGDNYSSRKEKEVAEILMQYPQTQPENNSEEI